MIPMLPEGRPTKRGLSGAADQAMRAENKRDARILIIDDDAQIRGMLLELLRANYECTEACSAEEALTLLHTEKFELVLSDIVMGGISGLEMVPHVLRRSPDTVIVMISGEQTIENAIEAMHVGAFDYVTKPFDLRHVETAVTRALKHHDLRAAIRRYEDHLEELVEQRTAERDHLTYHEALTGLPNRVLFRDRLARAVVHARRHQQLLAVIFIAIDRFKSLNDTLGHVVGDQLLCGVAERLSSFGEGGDMVASCGGEEFAILVTGLSHTEDAVKISQNVREVFKSPLSFDDHELFVTASVGISLYPHDGEDAQTLLQHTGVALHRAKEQGGDNYQFYRADMNEQALRQLGLENSLRRALEREEFVVHYQPQINTLTEQIVGVEALVRWRHPELGLISPMEFIPLAEETGLIVPIGEWVLRTACAQNKEWQDEGFAPLRMSVNFSPRQFQQPGLVEQIRRSLGETGLAPHYLEVELTESSVMKDAELAIRTLRRLKETGVRVSIDDFGTGYSSLSYLKRFPIDTLKIDISFVRHSTTDPRDAAIVTAIITLAHSLGLKVIAEGVETEEQLGLLRALGCDEIQGYLFGKPLPAAALAELLSQGQNPIVGERP
jgi:diguanylate cyclase (GGDEF)-like protein